MTIRRPLLAIIGSGALALSLVACGQDDDQRAGDDAPGTETSASPSDDEGTATDEPTETETEAADTFTVPVYYLVEGPRGDRLIREFRRLEGDSALDAAVAGLAGTPLDPDYRPVTDILVSASVQDDVIEVSSEAVDVDISPEAAALVTQAIVYTVQGTVGERLPVRLDGGAAGYAEAAGLDPARVTAGDPLEYLHLVEITEPAEGAEVTGTITVEGRASSFENTVPWHVLDEAGERVLEGFSTADGDWMTGLAAWSTEIDLSGLEPGTYTLVAETDDPSGGEGAGPSSDTKTLQVS